MRRRVFLGGIGAAGGAALVGLGGLARAAVRQDLLARIREAKLTISGRLVLAGPNGDETMDVALEGARLSGRRSGRLGSLALTASPVGGGRDALELGSTVRAGAKASVLEHKIVLGLGAWTRDSYLVLPGLCYAGNRFQSRRPAAYPPLLTEPADIGPHVPPIITDVPHLNVREGPSSIEVLTGDLATPGAAIHLPGLALGLILLVAPGSSLGDTGLSIVENDTRTGAELAFGAPFSGEARGGTLGDPTAPGRLGGAPRAGGTGGLRARLYLFDCPDVAALFRRLFVLRKEVTGPNAVASELPFSAAFAAHEERVARRWRERPGFIATGNGDSAYSTWQTGWCGGLMETLPLLVAGSKPTRERALATIDFALDGGQAPSGFFHAVFDGKTWHDDGFTASLPAGDGGRSRPAYKHARRWHLVRRSADALTFLLKQLALVEQDRHATKIDARWPKAVRRTADAFVRLWERYHQLGQFVDVATGELVVGGSTSGALAPAGLARASTYFKEPRYLAVAQAIAEQQFERYLRRGLTCGGPGDALQCPDSQSAAALLESFVTLYETTRERIWIDRAEAAAHLLATWVISHDGRGRDRGCRGGAEIRSAGAVFSSAQSRHGTPGYLLLSGDALFRLYRATGDRELLELLRDTVRNLAQYLRVPEGSSGTRDAAACSGIDTADWVARDAGVVPSGAVFDAIALLAYTEVPGVYVQSDKAFVFAFDHVQAKVAGRRGAELVLRLSNPNAVDAAVRVLAETSSQAAEPLPLGQVAATEPTVVPARGSVELVL